MAHSILSLSTVVGVAALFACLIASVGFAVALATNRVAAGITAIPLTAVTTHADREDSATLRRATYLQALNGFDLTDGSPHLGIMPDPTIGRMTLPAAG
jgi:hypothetical protein